MGILDIFKSKKEKNEFDNIIEIAKIISGNDSQVVDDMTLLAHDFEGFVKKYQQWCDDMFVTMDCRQTNVINIFAYWLCGYDTDYKYGHYIDWKAELEDILYGLEEVIETLKYNINIDEYEKVYIGTYEMLVDINKYFNKTGYTLFTLDIGGDCYHLFITSIEDFEKITKLSKKVGFEFGL